MGGSVTLNVPSYLPTLFASSTPGSSLLASLSASGSLAPGTVNPITAAQEQAKTAETQQVARQSTGSGGTDLTKPAAPSAGLVV